MYVYVYVPYVQYPLLGCFEPGHAISPAGCMRGQPGQAMGQVVTFPRCELKPVGTRCWSICFSANIIRTSQHYPTLTVLNKTTPLGAEARH